MQQRLGRYELLERIASGGQGIVWRARDTVLDRVVAIKVLNQPVAGDPRYLEALQREARLAAGLVHPNITAVHDFQVEGDIAYIVMEYVPDTLSIHMQRGHPLSYQRAVEIAIQICRALSHAHTQEIIHRDIKLQNILLTEEGNVKVSDFGIARALASSTRSSATGTMGTPFYMSPEQWGGARVDGRADIYSLGILLYEMLTGSVPFRAENIGAMYVQHRESAIPEISSELGVPDAVEAVMRMALEKDPENRFNSADAMANALQRSLNPDAAPERAYPATTLPRESTLGTPTPPTQTSPPPRESTLGTPTPPTQTSPPLPYTRVGGFNSRRMRLLLPGVALVIVLAIAIVSLIVMRLIPPAPDRITVSPPSTLQIDLGNPDPTNFVPAWVSAKTHYEKGLEIYNDERYDEAIVEFTAAIDLLDDFAEAYNHRGIAFYQLGQSLIAITDYDEAIQRDPEEPAYYYNRKLAYVALGQLENADADEVILCSLGSTNCESNLRTANTSSPAWVSAKTHYEKGLEIYNDERYDEAIVEFTAAIDLLDDFAEAYNHRGIAFYQLGQSLIAITDYDKAIQRDPEEPAYYYNRKLAYVALGQLENADADEVILCSLGSNNCESN